MGSEGYKSFKVEGLCSPPASPFKANGDLNVDVIPRYVDHLLSQGVKNAFVTGTTGEGNALTMDERKQTLEAWVKAGKGKLSAVIAQIGAGNLRDSKVLAAHAEETGADAIACVGPSFYKPQTEELYVEYMRQVAASAPKTPFILYDIDFFTGITFDVNRFFHLAKDKIPTLRGVKHTSPSFPSMNNVMHDHHGDYQVMLGSDEMFLQALALGIDVTICNSYLGNVLNRLKAAFDSGNMEAARLEQDRAHMMCAIRRKYGFTVVGGSKAMLRATTDLEVGDPRIPLSPNSDSTIESLKQDLKDIGYFEWGLAK